MHEKSILRLCFYFSPHIVLVDRVVSSYSATYTTIPHCLAKPAIVQPIALCREPNALTDASNDAYSPGPLFNEVNMHVVLALFQRLQCFSCA